MNEVSGYYLVIGYPLACIPSFTVLNAVLSFALNLNRRVTCSIAVVVPGALASGTFFFLLLRSDLLR